MQLNERIYDFLDKCSDKRKAEFDKKLIFTKYKIKGLKTKDIENFSKILAKEKVNIFDMKVEFFEQTLIIGFYIAFVEENKETKIELIKKFLKYVDNWATCDMFVSRLKGTQDYEDFFISLLNSSNPFTKRVGIVWIMRNIIKYKLDYALNLLINIKDENYYVKMAIAWTYAECFTLDSNKMINFLSKIKDKFIRNQTILKSRQSFRVSKEVKDKIINYRL